MAPSKRKAEVIDLTGDDDDGPVKKGRSSAASSKSVQNPSQPPTRPASSQLSSSQTRYNPPSSSQSRYGSLNSSRYGGTNFTSAYAQGIYSQSSEHQSHSFAERESWLQSTQENEADIHREIDLEEDFDDDVYANHQLYGIMNTKVVGIRFYNGRATVGEYVKIRREPGNPYDRNAIRIDNVMGVQIGHISRNNAAKLAPFIDSGKLLIEGALTGQKGEFDVPIGLKLFGTSDAVACPALKKEMQDQNLPVGELTKFEKDRERKRKELEKQQKAREKAAADLKKKGGAVFDTEGPNKYANFAVPGNGEVLDSSMDSLLSGTASFNPREVRDVVHKFAATEDVLANMPMAEQPTMIATLLLPYQKQALKWMMDQESPKLPANNSGDVVQLWKMSHNIYTNIATSFSVSRAPELASGGILADDMGLGKTLETLSLIMSDPHKTKQPTLIVAPLSVMSNWSSQAGFHVKKKYQPRILTYHGQENRGLTPEQFTEYDLVITTYQTMAQELYPFGQTKPQPLPAKRGLFAVHWRRIVLDEGHQIRNPKAKMAQAACSLQAKSRWILTGTPIVNSLKDLYSHVKFLRLSGGLTEFEIFNGTLIRPLKNNDENAKLLLRALMTTLCLRRMKEMKFVDLRLPDIVFHRYPVQFLSHEQERYDAFKAQAKGLVEAAKAKKGDNTMTHLLEVLLRLRQTCNHWKMCGQDRVLKLLDLVQENESIDVTNSTNRKALQTLLQIRIDGQEDCAVCLDSFTAPVITACAHIFCRTCIEKVIETQHKCPMCRSELANDEMLVSPLAGFGECQEEEIEIGEDVSSSKIEVLIKVLKASEQEKNTKTVVFSQWTSFLDLVQAQLSQHGLNFTRLDGKMNATQRDAAVEALNTDSSCRILLASLSVCSVGLNLVAANQVILSDSWWAPAIEDQAVDRIHRLGQTRACKVIRLVVEGTIEDEVLELQARKRKLAGMAFGEKNGARTRKEMRAGTLRDIEKLLA